MKVKAKYSAWPIGDYCDVYAICVPCGAQVSVMLPTGIWQKVRTNMSAERPVSMSLSASLFAADRHLIANSGHWTGQRHYLRLTWRIT
jgi:hypothetical protein